MGSITIINKYHCDDPDSFYIGRGSPLGNPYTVKQYGRDRAIALYGPWLEEQIAKGNGTVIDALDEIANKLLRTGEAKLKCFCAPKPCHGHIIKDLVIKTIKEMQHA